MTKKILFIYFTLVALSQGQEIPNEFFKFQSQKLLYDSGDDWQTITTFGPIRFNRLVDYDPGNDSLKIDLK